MRYCLNKQAKTDLVILTQATLFTLGTLLLTVCAIITIKACIDPFTWALYSSSAIYAATIVFLLFLSVFITAARSWFIRNLEPYES